MPKGGGAGVQSRGGKIFKINEKGGVFLNTVEIRGVNF